MCLSRLINLKTLAIGCNHKPISSAINGMAAANIQLEHLKIDRPSIREIDMLFGGIAKLNTLKSLKLFEVYGMALRHVTQIAENLVELTELQLSNSLELNADSLLQLIRSNKKLQSFYYHEISSECNSVCFTDGYLQNEMMKIAEKRRKKMHVKISESTYSNRMLTLPLPNNYQAFSMGLTLSIK